MGETLAFSADDRAFALGGRYHTLQGEARAAVLIAGAMGVTQDYYAEFAQWLAAQGSAALGFDHRDMGESLPASVSSGASSNPR
jgi:predicted alpha/beta hydrolase